MRMLTNAVGTGLPRLLPALAPLPPDSHLAHVRKLNNVTCTCQTPTKRPLKDVYPRRRSGFGQPASCQFAWTLVRSRHDARLCRSLSAKGRSSMAMRKFNRGCREDPFNSVESILCARHIIIKKIIKPLGIGEICEKKFDPLLVQRRQISVRVTD